MAKGPLWWRKWTVEYQIWQQKQTLSPKKVIGCVLGVLVFSGGLFVTVKMTQQQIRAQQLTALVAPENTSTKLEMIPYGQLDQLIQTKPAVSVLFAAPNTKELAEVIQLMTQKEQELNRKIYWYPLVYDQAVLHTRYDVSDQAITFVFFQNGIEKKRVLFHSLADPKTELIPEINRLPMWNITDQKKH